MPSEQSPSGSATYQPASTTDTKSSSDGVTGLTPEQVFQELKKSGYVDQLRRQMFDAFTAASTPPKNNPATASSPTLTAPNGSQAAVSASTSASQPIAAPTSSDASSSGNAGPTSAPTSTAEASAPSAADAKAQSASGTQQTVDVGSKAAFLQFLAAPLRYHVEKEHDTLRFEDQRGQQNKLLKLLESDHVSYAGGAEHGDATLYDLLVRHIVAASPTSTSTATGTAGMLAKDGTVGKEGYGRIADTINEMLHPAGKDGEEEDDDDDEDADEDEAEGGAELNPQPVSAQAQGSHNGAAQSSHTVTSEMDQD